MTNPIIYEDMTIKTANPEIYKELVENKKLFAKSLHLFTSALAVGIILNKKSEKKAHHDLIRFSTVSDLEQKILVTTLARISCEGNDKKERGKVLLTFADGGLEYIWQEYQLAGNLDVSRLIGNIKNKCTEKTEEMLESIVNN